MIVVDASAILTVLLGEPGEVYIEDRLLGAGESLHAPHLLDLEVVQTLRRSVSVDEMTSLRGRQALTNLGDFPIIRYPHDLFLPRIWTLRHNATAYDAAYIALAEALSASLLTCDARLAAVPGHRTTIELVRSRRPD